MQFDGAVIKEQGVTFAVVVVKPTVLNSSNRESVRNEFAGFFPGVPVVLMSQDGKGIPTYHGRRDIVRFLSNVNPRRIPWKRYSMN